jgi:hypothetical protein
MDSEEALRYKCLGNHITAEAAADLDADSLLLNSKTLLQVKLPKSTLNLIGNHDVDLQIMA